MSTHRRRFIQKDEEREEIKLLYQVFQIFAGPLKHATWIHDIKMNVQEKLKIRIVQMSFSPALCKCEFEELEQRERGQCHDFPHEIITHYKNYQVNAWFRKKQEQKEM